MEDLEKTFYPIVAKWLGKNHHCFRTAQNTGLKYSRADVIGIRDTGGDLTCEIETIVVEVKRGSEAFATASGQAYGYIVYANRVYLADKKINGFSQEELQIASHLGIGLILIDKNNKCHEVLSSPYYKPLTKLNSSLLEKLRLGMCQLCHCYVEIGDESNRHNQLEKKKFKKAIADEKGFMFWNYEVGDRKEKLGIRVGRENTTYERRFLCKDCVSMFGQLSTEK
jgi:hypothetical protein